ncbi:MAG: ribose-phosphate pyrophosphokinase [Sumerlaeia bacterium]
MSTYNDPPVILPGSASRSLTMDICHELAVPMGDLMVERFSDAETFVKIGNNLRGRDVFIVQSTSNPVNENLMELLLTIDAARRASADRITAVIPYYGYARQDRKSQGRVALSAKLVANMIATAGADRVLALNLHSAQIQGFFDLPLDHLEADPILVKCIRELGLKNACVVSPDVGNVKSSRNFADMIKTPLAIIDKRRPRPNESEVMAIIGKVYVENNDVVIFDDMIDTAGTICNAARALRDAGARDVYAIATHGVFSGPALERLAEAPFKEVIVTNSIAQDKSALSGKVRLLNIAPLLASAIDRIHRHTSVSALFRDEIG